MKATAILGFVLLVSVGCAAPAPQASTPAAPAGEAAPSSLAGPTEAPAEPTTLAEAEALLEKARADLDRLALNEPGAAPATAAAPAPAPPAAATRAEAERPAEKAAAADDAGESSAKREAGPCETACKAFSSLERASDAVCRLDTESPAKRCERAKQIKDEAARRVTSCACR